MKISISNISGEIKSEIGSLVRFYSVKMGRPYVNFLNKGVFGTKLANLLNESHAVAPELLKNELGIQKKDGSLDVPMTYENWLILQNKIDNLKFPGIFAA